MNQLTKVSEFLGGFEAGVVNFLKVQFGWPYCLVNSLADALLKCFHLAKTSEPEQLNLSKRTNPQT